MREGKLGGGEPCPSHLTSHLDLDRTRQPLGEGRTWEGGVVWGSGGGPPSHWRGGLRRQASQGGGASSCLSHQGSGAHPALSYRLLISTREPIRGLDPPFPLSPSGEGKFPGLVRLALCPWDSQDEAFMREACSLSG